MDTRNTVTSLHEIYPNDTIAAISTPTGEGGIGIIRLSGPEAITLACQVFRRADGRALEDPAPFHQYYGHIIDPHSELPVDEVLLCTMRAPRSYTREAMAEISAHGGPVPLRAILTLLISAGARLAQPGEFTQRAFLNGRLDLTQAEAVLDTIHARTAASLRAAQSRLQGTLGRQVQALRRRLVSLLASLEAAIDYADEDLTFLTPAEIGGEITEIRRQVAALIASHTHGKLLRDGAATVIVGRPNTGKSSILNALLGEERAIVTDVPGTTRDVIEEQVDIGGIPLRLLDTAGIRDTDDAVERLGVARSRDSLAQADLVVLVLDGATALTADDLALMTVVRDRPVVIALNKADLPTVIAVDEIQRLLPAPMVAVSALHGHGMPALETAIHQLLLDPAVSESPMLATLRQREAAERAAEALTHANDTLLAGGTEELLAVDLMGAAAALGEITGDDIRADVLQDLFARFCVGK